MGLVLQTQRRAIESVIFNADGKPCLNPPIEAVERWQDFRLQCEYGIFRLHLIGVSRGIGTCSDVHDANVAVFGLERPDRQLMCKLPALCKGAVILRKRQEGESDSSNELYEHQLPIAMAVEGLAHHESKSYRYSKHSLVVCFVRNGLKKLYIPL